MTPDQVKALFKDNAFDLAGTSPLAQGSGELNLTAWGPRYEYDTPR
jgi:hypothetical protein